jgi:hypothetical protein
MDAQLVDTLPVAGGRSQGAVRPSGAPCVCVCVCVRVRVRVRGAARDCSEFWRDVSAVHCRGAIRRGRSFEDDGGTRRRHWSVKTTQNAARALSRAVASIAPHNLPPPTSYAPQSLVLHRRRMESPGQMEMTIPQTLEIFIAFSARVSILSELRCIYFQSLS